MTDDTAILQFDGYTLDRANRRLARGGEVLDIGSRYFDALVLLVEARGRLVTKDHFMDQVWRGVPVTDEALTQCIRSLRRALDDDAANPRFIATVPKHGYRFVASLEKEHPPKDEAFGTQVADRQSATGRMATAAMLGGAGAGIAGGLFYALLLASRSGEGASALFLTVLALCLAVGVLGGAGVGLGMAFASALRSPGTVMLVAGGGAGGLVVGAVGRLVGLDLFQVLAGTTIGPVTGLLEGAVIGMLTGAGCALAMQFPGTRGGALAALLGAGGGALVSLAGGRLMAGSLALLDRRVADSRLGLDTMGLLLGEARFGTVSLVVSGALEAAVFVGCVALAVSRMAAPSR